MSSRDRRGVLVRLNGNREDYITGGTDDQRAVFFEQNLGLWETRNI
jgi:hypothetical protein